MVDRLLSSEHIVLARPRADNPFRYEAIQALEGSLESVEIPQLVDSATRRRLASDPEAQVLFARDGSYGPWRRVALIDGELSPVVDHVMRKLPEWELGGDADRLGYFATLLNSPDIRIQSLALRELDQADYGLLRALPLEIEPERILSRLNLLHEYDLSPIRILLLGLSQQPEILGLLEAGVARHTRSTGTLLGAYATAMIELGGPDAIDHLASTYLSDRSILDANRELIAEAMALHSLNGNPETRVAARAAISSSVKMNPELAPTVARQFGIRNDWTQADVLSEVLQQNVLTSPSDILLVSQYVALAHQDASQPAN